ncbi:sugar-binding protein [Pirellulales bacterium]|nr:sugar-binding protein [Pirellulales bacterium]
MVYRIELLLIAGALIVVRPSLAADIIWVSDGRSPQLADLYNSAIPQGWSIETPTDAVPYDQGFVDLLSAAGHSVDYRVNGTTGDAAMDWESNGSWQGALTPQQTTDLNAADLVIVSPDVQGTQYVSAKSAWDGLTVPVLSLTAEVTRGEVWNWMGRPELVEVNLNSETEPRFMRAKVNGTSGSGYGLRDSNESVQYDFIDETAGSQKVSFINWDWDEVVFTDLDPPESNSRLVAVTGEETFNNNPWTASSGKGYLQWHDTWESGQQYYPGETTGSTPAGRRELFNAAGAANTNVDGFYVGAGVENLTTAGEVRLMDLVQEITVASSADLRQNRPIPKFSPTIDGSVSQSEMDSQTEISMVFPYSGGSILESTFIENMQGFTEERLSAKWYVSWDDDNLYVTAAVKDDSPIYTQVGGGSFINQDSVQFNFNPNDDPAGGAKRAYDAVVETGDSAGPSVERSGGVPVPAINLVGQETADGYILEMAIPWSEAMLGAGGANYIPSNGDQHGLSFQLRGKNNATQNQNAQDAITSHYIDYGNWEGLFENNFLFDQTFWNMITLIDPNALSADLNGDGNVDGKDFLIGQQQGFPGDFLTDWNSQYGSASANSSFRAVPEPGSCLLFAITCLSTQLCRPKRRLFP